MGRTDDRQWYVLRTKPRHEAIAQAHLRRKSIEVYLPRLVVQSARGLMVRSTEQATEPLFPGYLFLRLQLPGEYAVAAWTPGVRNFLSFGDDAPAPLDDAVIECIRERAGGGDVLRPLRPWRAGDQVEIRIGPFAGLLAVIDRPVSGARRVQVLLDLLRRRTRLDLPASAVARV
jgi:transcriptional antiterminator RfaH